jgi:hypothetical protein
MQYFRHNAPIMIGFSITQLFLSATVLTTTMANDLVMTRQLLKPCSATIAPHGSFQNQMLADTNGIYRNQEQFTATKVALNSVNLQAGKSAQGKSIIRLHIVDGKYIQNYRYVVQDGQVCNAHFPEPPAGSAMEVFVEDNIKYAG